MKRFIFFTLTGLLIFTAASATWYLSRLHYSGSVVAHKKPAIISSDVAFNQKINSMAATASQYAALHQFNTQYCFLVDMSIESGKQRFFVYDMKKNIVMKSGLVTHGCCNKKWLTGRQYGNSIGCGCTSLGKYKIGNPYKGKFGLAYKLFGLDTTNSNAYNRFVVLHSMQCVPESEVNPYPICQSDGCPTVSPGFLKELSLLIDASKQPVLLWIYE